MLGVLSTGVRVLDFILRFAVHCTAIDGSTATLQNFVQLCDLNAVIKHKAFSVSEQEGHTVSLKVVHALFCDSLYSEPSPLYYLNTRRE